MNNRVVAKWAVFLKKRRKGTWAVFLKKKKKKERGQFFSF